MKNSTKDNLDYSIGVVTYVARFESYFIPIIKQLTAIFPDKEIVCVINGHHDKTLQVNYLKQVTAFLSQFPNVRYVTQETHQPLAKCWNWLLLLSYAPRMLVLNDDLDISLLFRNDFEKALRANQTFFTINHSWSHFLIAKDYMKKIGWFDERLLGTGQEDGDYQIRIWDNGDEVNDIVCHGVVNYIAPQLNAGWAGNLSSFNEGGKQLAAINKEFIGKKYDFSPQDPCHGRLRTGMETPLFYDLNCLDNKDIVYNLSNIWRGNRPSIKAKIFLPLNILYSYSRKFLGRIYRFLKNKI